MIDTLLVGAGGHAKVVREIVEQSGHRIAAYAAPDECSWLEFPRYDDHAPILDHVPQAFVMGIGGVTPDKLRRRLDLYHSWLNRGLAPLIVLHPSAVVSKSAEVEDGSCVLAGAVLQPSVRIGEAAIINTRAVIEHDAHVGEGAHIAPGAVVLAEARIGPTAMIGAQAIVLPRAVVPHGAFVRAGELFPNCNIIRDKDA